MYAAEISLLDDWLGRFLTRLDQLGLSNTWVAVVSDHGVSLGEHGLIGKDSNQLHGELIDVPFMIRHPQRAGAGRRTGYFASSHDIAPTLLRGVGAPVPKAMDGADLRPLFDGRRGQARPVWTGAWGDTLIAGDGRWLYVAENDGGRIRTERLHDTRSDPGEYRDLARRRPDLVRKFRGELAKAAGKQGFPTAYPHKRQEASQRPANSGWRFSKNARVPSAKSSVAASGSWAWTSCSSVAASAGLADGVDHPLGQPDRARRARQQLVGERLGERVELVGRGDPVREADPVRLAAVDHLAGHDQLLGVAEPDDRPAAASSRRRPAAARCAPRASRPSRPRPSRASRPPAPARTRRRGRRRGSGRSSASASPRAGSTSRGARARKGRRLAGFSDSSCRSPRSMPEENIGPSPRTTTTRTDVVGGRRLEAPRRAPRSARR